MPEFGLVAIEDGHYYGMPYSYMQLNDRIRRRRAGRKASKRSSRRSMKRSEVKYTKKGQPYVIDASGKARFISKKEIKKG